MDPADPGHTGRLKLALGRCPPGAADIDVRDFQPPDSALAREAESACGEQPELIAEHFVPHLDVRARARRARPQ